MWIFTTRGFYSAVADPRSRDLMVVRARQPGALAALRELMPGLSEETITNGRDYRYRASITRERFAEGMAAVALDVDYPNFKDAATARHEPPRKKGKKGKRSAYIDVLHDVWARVGWLQPGGPYSSGWGVAIPRGEPKPTPAEKLGGTRR